MLKGLRALLITVPFLIITYIFVWLFVLLKNVLPLKIRYFLGRAIILFCNYGLAVKVKITNRKMLKYPGNVIYYGNHQAVYDILTMISISKLPICALAKKEVRRYPIVGNISYFIGCTYLDRSNLRASLKVIENTTEEVKKGARFVVFPEGTRTKDDNKDIGEFKGGSFKIALNSHATIIPFAIDGAYTVLDAKYPMRRTKVRVRFGDPIPYEEYKDKSTSELAGELKEIISSHFEEIRVAPKQKKKKKETEEVVVNEKE